MKTIYITYFLAITDKADIVSLAGLFHLNTWGKTAKVTISAMLDMARKCVSCTNQLITNQCVMPTLYCVIFLNYSLLTLNSNCRFYFILSCTHMNYISSKNKTLKT